MITEDKIRDFVADGDTKRICFSRIQKHALWKTENNEDMLTIPFGDSIGILLREQTGVAVRRANSGNYYAKLSPDEFEIVSSFVTEYSDVVFLRDLLDVSVALSLNYEEDCVTHTPVGLLEKNAKYDNNGDAVDQLTALVDDFIGKNPCYRDADFICAVPLTKNGEVNLPLKVLSKLTLFNGEDISSCVQWVSKTKSLKDVEGTDKLEILKQSGFKIADGIDFMGKRVVLVDDLYMSGTTLQYVAMRLKEAGAEKVYGLCFVKSLSNK